VLPTDFVHWQFAVILFVSGMTSTLQNSGMALSIGDFFSTLIAGLASTMPAALLSGLTQQNVPTTVATNVANRPPVSTLFAAFLGYNPMQKILDPQVLAQLPPANAATVVGKEFFPRLVADSFHHGLVIVFLTAIAISLIGATASLFRGPRYIYNETPTVGPRRELDRTHVSGAGNVGTVEFTTPVPRFPARAAGRRRGVAGR
jgi:hypothetical protein